LPDALHKIVVGMSGTGKTVLANAMARRVRKLGLNVIVLDPWFRPGRWDCDWGTANPQEFLSVAKRNTHCFRIVDECNQVIPRGRSEFDVLMTDGRQSCNVTMMMMQHYADVSPAVRGQAYELYLFRCIQENGEAMSRIWPHPQLADCPSLPVSPPARTEADKRLRHSEYFWVRGTEPLRKMRLYFSRSDKPVLVKEYPLRLAQFG
jgi:hypothetical protein